VCYRARPAASRAKGLLRYCVCATGLLRYCVCATGLCVLQGSACGLACYGAPHALQFVLRGSSGTAFVLQGSVCYRARPAASRATGLLMHCSLCYGAPQVLLNACDSAVCFVLTGLLCAARPATSQTALCYDGTPQVL